MSGTHKRTFSLPEEHSKFIDSKVNSGAFASGSEVVRAGLRALQERDAAIERWLREEVAPVYDRWAAGEEETLSLDAVFDQLETEIDAAGSKR